MAGNNYYSNIEPKNIATTSPYLDKGQSYTGNLQSAFSASPIHSGELTSAERQEAFEMLVLSGKIMNPDGSEPSILNGNFGSGISRDYIENGAPDIANIDITDDAILGETLPSPYMPNPSSPGVGSFDASDKSTFNGKIKDANTVNAQFGSGRNGLYNPAESSKKLSDLGLGSYLPGKSGGN